ncbi:toll-like receptor 4 [Diadema antillarum]|uniref:toll-like receptor 4 n=1 Tax=Diadema antillarum TaxID=105358 RepID=UPI003A86430A
MTRLTTLKLEYNSISKLHSDFFKDQGRLVRLTLHHNQVGKLPDNVFNHTRNIEVLDLSFMNNGLMRIPGPALRGLQKLRQLTFRSNRLQSASFGTGLSLPALRTLDLGKNKITSLQDGDFVALRNTSLTTLSLSENSIKEVGSKVFRQFRSIDSVDFSRGLDPSVIPSLAIALSDVRTQKLLLSAIGLKKWDGDNFKDLRNSSLTILDLSSNNITQLDSSFTGLTNITNLSLAGNDIRDITKSAFTGLHALRILDLSGNKLTSLREGMFASLLPAPVDHLYLNKNVIANLSGANVFNGLPKLKYLKLALNKISQNITGDEFQGLNQLEVLDMGANVNVSLSGDAFRHVTSLQTLYLNVVGLRNITITPSPFLSLRALKKLDLSNNNMAAVNVNTFANLQKLETLYLQHNNLYNMWNETIMVPFLRNLRTLRYLDLCNNGFQNIPNRTFVDQSGLESLSLCRNKISHLQDDVFTGLSLRSLDLSQNQINLINSTIMEPILDSLEKLKVISNPFSCSCDLRWFRNWLSTTTVSVVDLKKTKCASPPSMRNKPLMSFHPEYLNCDHELPLYAWILIGVGSASIAVITGLVVRFRWYIMYYFHLINAKRKHYVRLGGDDTNFLYHAFVSFCNKDKDWIEEELLPHLEEQHNFRLCVHERDFVLGRKIMESIVEAVDNSRFTICLLSENYLESRWCKMEREFAMANIIHRDVLIIIVLGDIPINKLTRYYKLHKTMMNRTYLKWPDQPGRERDVFWQKLVDVLRDPDMRVNMNNNV